MKNFADCFPNVWFDVDTAGWVVKCIHAGTFNLAILSGKAAIGMAGVIPNIIIFTYGGVINMGLTYLIFLFNMAVEAARRVSEVGVYAMKLAIGISLKILFKTKFIYDTPFAHITDAPEPVVKNRRIKRLINTYFYTILKLLEIIKNDLRIKGSICPRLAIILGEDIDAFNSFIQQDVNVWTTEDILKWGPILFNELMEKKKDFFKECHSVYENFIPLYDMALKPQFNLIDIRLFAMIPANRLDMDPLLPSSARSQLEILLSDSVLSGATLEQINGLKVQFNEAVNDLLYLYGRREGLAVALDIIRKGGASARAFEPWLDSHPEVAGLEPEPEPGFGAKKEKN